MKTARFSHGMVFYGDKTYVFGGNFAEGDTNQTDECETYSGGRWRKKGKLT